MMMDILGVPSKDVIFRGERWKQFFNRDGSIKFVNNELNFKIKKRSLNSIIITDNPYFVSFIEV